MHTIAMVVAALACPVPATQTYTSVPGDMLRQPRGRGVLDRFGIEVQDLDATNPGALRRVYRKGARLYYLPPRTTLAIPPSRAERQAYLACEHDRVVALEREVAELRASLAAVARPAEPPPSDRSFTLVIASIVGLIGFAVGRSRRRTPPIEAARAETLIEPEHWGWRAERAAFWIHPYKFDCGILRCTCGENLSERAAHNHIDLPHFRCIFCRRVYLEPNAPHPCLFAAAPAPTLLSQTLH